MSRTFFIGDVHGCAEELAELLEKFAPRAGDEIYQTGDLINKGPSSVEALKLAAKRGIKCVLGNHEAKLLQILGKPYSERTPKEAKLLESVHDPEWVASIVSKFPLSIDTGKEMLLHAGIEPGRDNIEDMDRNSILTIRMRDGLPWYEQAYLKGRVIIFGHWAMNGLVDFPHAKGLDTGCVYGKLLTGYCPQENKFYQVAAKKEYTEGKGLF